MNASSNPSLHRTPASLLSSLQRGARPAPVSSKPLGHRSLFNAASTACFVGIVSTAQLLPASLMACQCGSIPEPPAALASSVAVLKGRVMEVSDPLWFVRRAWLRVRNFFLKPDLTPEWYLENAGFRVRIRSEQSWMRSLSGNVTIVTGRGGGDCGFHFKID